MAILRHIDLNELNARRLQILNQRWRAVGSDGRFLHLNGTDFTKDEFWAWRGNNKQFAAMQRLHNGTLEAEYVGVRENYNVRR